MAEDRFVMPEGMTCDVPGCGMPATDALVATSNPGHVYICRPHWQAITSDRMRLPEARHDYWKERKAGSS